MSFLTITTIDELKDAITIRPYDSSPYCTAHGLVADTVLVMMSIRAPISNGSRDTVYENHVQFITKPHGNCQVSAIGYVNNIIYMLEGIVMPGTLKKKAGSVVIHKLIEFSNYKQKNQTSNTMFTIDVFAELMPKVKKYFNVVVETPPYVSTNGSTLQLAIIKI